MVPWGKVCSFAITLLISANSLPADELAYQPGRIIVKFTSDVGQFQLRKQSAPIALGFDTLDDKMERYDVHRIQPLFPHKDSQLGHIHQLDFNDRCDVLEVASAFARDEHVIYAEPCYIDRLCGVPNDPDYLAGLQWYLERVQAPQAWDIVQGDSSVIIAIVDSGVDWDHPDLYSNMWINPGEDIDGDGRITGADWNLADDDSNGYADDFFGWDFGGYGYPDWNPMENPGAFGPHGTHCAGIAAAVTDNALGVAGLSWNCSIMAVKVTEDENPAVYFGYQGIQYATDNGADIINISWGRSIGNPSQFQQEVIDSAFARGAIVVAAAGNDPGVLPPDTCALYYPAWYDHVIAVAASDEDDRILDWSFYGPWVDVCAPGTGIYNTFWDNTYGTREGTSMATPVVAGVAGLLKTVDPDMSSDQFEALMWAASDNIEGLNPGYDGWLGGGRLNAYRALQETVPVVLAGFEAVGGPRGIILSWDTAAEVNCQRWEIYRAAEEWGEYFRVGQLPGQGSTESAHQYRWVDRDVTAGVTYFYKLRQVDFDGRTTWSSVVSATISVTVLKAYALHQNCPNPFNATTRIRYDIPEDGHVAVRIFNPLGQEVRRLVDGPVAAGSYAIVWDGRDDASHQVASGLYICRMEAGGFGKTVKMVLLR